MHHLPSRPTHLSSQVLVKAPEGGLDADSVVLGEQVRVLDKKRLLRRRGDLTPATMARLNEALRIAFDLD
jgi:mRNA interferase MazF